MKAGTAEKGKILVAVPVIQKYFIKQFKKLLLSRCNYATE